MFRNVSDATNFELRLQVSRLLARATTATHLAWSFAAPPFWFSAAASTH